jgi:DNA-binding NarL/FixJ family response regulator
MPPLRILVADDHAIVRAGLRALLESRRGWTVIAEAADGRDAIEKVESLKPDIVILDIAMPLLNGIGAIGHIRSASPSTEILILTMHESADLLQQAIEAGARGYVLKNEAYKTLLDAVDAARQHKPFFSAALANSLPQGDPAVPSAKPPRARLTAREREILQLLAEGKSNKEIASLLNISVNTAEAHRANIMLKLNLHSVAELVHYAVRNHIITP